MGNTHKFGFEHHLKRADSPLREGIKFKDTFHIYNTFYQHPTQENFDRIQQQDHLWSKLGVKHKIFKLKAREKWDLLPRLTQEEQGFLENIENRLLYPATRLSLEDLDILWILLRASGEDKYPFRVKGIISSVNQHPIIRAAAQSSYISHVNLGFFRDGEYLLKYITGGVEDRTNVQVVRKEIKNYEESYGEPEWLKFKN